MDFEIIKRMVAHHVTRHPENAPDMLKELIKAQVVIQGAELQEVFLLQMIHLIWLGQDLGKNRFVEAAKAVNPNLDGLGMTMF